MPKERKKDEKSVCLRDEKPMGGERKKDERDEEPMNSREMRSRYASSEQRGNNKDFYLKAEARIWA